MQVHLVMTIAHQQAACVVVVVRARYILVASVQVGQCSRYSCNDAVGDNVRGVCSQLFLRAQSNDYCKMHASALLHKDACHHVWLARGLSTCYRLDAALPRDAGPAAHCCMMSD
jgi:hypothetical protein